MSIGLKILQKFVEHHTPIFIFSQNKKGYLFCEDCSNCNRSVYDYCNLVSFRVVPSIHPQELEDFKKSNPEYFL